MLPRLSGNEYNILDVLTENGNDLYGLQIVKLSGGRLKRGVIYVTLNRMIDKDLIEEGERFDEASNRTRRVYRVSAHGYRVFAAVSTAKSLFDEPPELAL